MSNLKLTAQFVECAAHVKLNKSRWWSDAKKQAVIAILFSTPEGLSQQQIHKHLVDDYNLTFSHEDVDSACKNLVRQKVIRENRTSRDYELMPNERDNYEKELNKYIVCEDQSKQFFLRSILDSGFPPKHKHWDEFYDSFLIPLFSRNTKTTLDYILYGKFSFDDNTDLTSYLEMYSDSNERAAISNAVSNFLLANNASISSYIATLAHASMVYQAGSLSKETIRQISKSLDKKPIFNVYLDTNVVLSAIGLSLHPAQSAIVSLLSLLNSVSSSISYRLMISPKTLEEVKSHIQWLAANTSKGTINTKLAKIILNTAASDFYKIIAFKVLSSDAPISPMSVLTPYISDLKTVLERQYKFTILPAEKPVFFRNPKFITLVETYKQRLMQLNKNLDEAKAYDRAVHDMYLLTKVREGREIGVESPLEAKYWIATLDRKLIQFDYGSRNNDNMKIACCVYPTVIANLLQFWVPREVALDQAIIGFMQLPIIGMVDNDDSKVAAHKIVNILSRQENVGDLGEDIMTSILVNEGLRSRITSEIDDATAVAMVNDTISEELLKSAVEKVALKKAVTDSSAAALAAELRAKADREAKDKAKSEAEFLRAELVKITKEIESHKIEFDKRALKDYQTRVKNSIVGLQLSSVISFVCIPLLIFNFQTNWMSFIINTLELTNQFAIFTVKYAVCALCVGLIIKLILRASQNEFFESESSIVKIRRILTYISNILLVSVGSIFWIVIERAINLQ